MRGLLGGCRANDVVSVLARRLVGMGNRARRARLAQQARAVPVISGCDCGCSAMGRVVFAVTCGACGRSWSGDLVMPTNGAVGDRREVFASCTCGVEAAGSGQIVQLLT